MDQQNCYWHPSRPTGLSCTRCGKAICVGCTFQHPVGIRCKECIKTHSLPIYQISITYLLRGFLAMIGTGTMGALISYAASYFFPHDLLIFFLFMLGLGYLIGEAISICLNRRRGGVYRLFPIGAVLIASLPWLFPYSHLFHGFNNVAVALKHGPTIVPLYLIGGVFISIVISVSRLRH